ncbi:MAG: hypothetical protein Q8908_02400 [Bacteroidota bacterium]|nr:hypothetical protein [Bacteroidota bacterium]
MMRTPKIKKKKIKYRSIIFKVTDNQKKTIDEYCRKSGLGTIQFVKMALKGFMDQNPTLQSNSDDYFLNENQLTIFDIIKETEKEA